METYSSPSRNSVETENHLLKRARELLICGDADAALDLLHAMDSDDRTADALHLTALAWTKACKPERAIEALELALEQNPNKQGWWLDLATLQYAQGRWPQSADSFGRAAALRELDGKSLRLYASALRLAGEYGLSIETLEEYLSANPGDVDRRTEVAQLYGMCGFHHEELRHRHVLGAKRANASSLAALARAEMQAGQMKLALATAHESLETEPDSQLGSEYLVMLLHSEEQTASSVRDAHEHWSRRYTTRKDIPPTLKHSAAPKRP